MRQNKRLDWRRNQSLFSNYFKIVSNLSAYLWLLFTCIRFQIFFSHENTFCYQFFGRIWGIFWFLKCFDFLLRFSYGLIVNSNKLLKTCNNALQFSIIFYDNIHSLVSVDQCTEVETAAQKKCLMFTNHHADRVLTGIRNILNTDLTLMSFYHSVMLLTVVKLRRLMTTVMNQWTKVWSDK